MVFQLLRLGGSAIGGLLCKVQGLMGFFSCSGIGGFFHHLFSASSLWVRIERPSQLQEALAEVPSLLSCLGRLGRRCCYRGQLLSRMTWERMCGCFDTILTGDAALTTPVGLSSGTIVLYQIVCISDIYTTIHQSSKIAHIK